MDCPTDAQLAAHLGEFSAGAAPPIDHHLRECSSCRGLLELLRSSSGQALRTHDELAVVLRVARRDIAWADELVGRVLGRYRVLAVAGVGAMGAVFRARDEELDRDVALKILSAPTPANQQLRLEALAAAQMRHPNVVELFDVHLDHDPAFLVMEFVLGEGLRQWLAGEHGVDARLRLLAGAGRGLAHAHEAGIVHGDFKPENVMVGADGRARVFDFGLAALAHRWERRGAGTPAYMAPESLRGAASTSASDQYAFAVVAYEVLTGHRPFEGRTLEELERSIDGDGPRWDHRALRDEHVRAPLQRALSADPAQRFGSMSALLDALRPARTPRGSAGAAGWAMLAGVAALGPVIAFAQVDPPACELSSDPVWTPVRRASIDESSARLVARPLTRFDASVAEVVRNVCEDRQNPDELRIDHVRGCLARQRSSVDELVSIVTTAAPEQIERARTLVQRLPRPADCLEAQHGRPVPSPRAQALAQELSRARVQTRLGAIDDGKDRVAAVLVEARDLEDPFLLAEALLAAGHTDSELGNHREAERFMDEAFDLASSIGADAVAFEAARSLAYLKTEQNMLTVAADWLRHAEAAMLRLPPSAQDPAALWSTKGSYNARNGRPAEARRFHERALAHYRAAPGDWRYEIAEQTGLIGYTYYDERDWPAARDLFAEATDRLREAGGDRHPELASFLEAAGAAEYAEGKLARAASLFERALELKRANAGPNSPAAAITSGNLGALYQESGESHRALELLTTSLTLVERHFGADSARAFAPNLNLGKVELDLGHTESARRHFIVALEIARAQYGEDHERFKIAEEHLAGVQSVSR